MLNSKRRGLGGGTEDLSRGGVNGKRTVVADGGWDKAGFGTMSVVEARWWGFKLKKSRYLQYFKQCVNKIEGFLV